jgi:hypothetical protein
MCTVLLPPGVNPIAVNKYIIFFSLMPNPSCLSLLPLLLFHFFCPSMTCFRTQFLRKMSPIQLAIFVLYHVGCSSPPWLCVTFLHSSIDRSELSIHHSPAPHFKISNVFLLCCPKCARFKTIYCYAPYPQFHEEIKNSLHLENSCSRTSQDLLSSKRLFKHITVYVQIIYYYSYRTWWLLLALCTNK